jgi:ElaB/YqjD/DUF883 family membrane-anchored ribosome-binding protein
MSDSGIKYANDASTPPSGTSFQPAGGLNDTGASFSADSSATGGRVDEAKQVVRENASKLTAQAGDKAREYAEQGKAKAFDALGQLSRTIEDAAQQVEEKLGPQYGQYVRSAAGQVTTLADRIQATDVDQLADDVRGYVRQSPGVAIGAAAAVGFVLARLVQAGIDGKPD